MAEMKKEDERVLMWVNRIAAARKREDEYRKQGQRAKDIYDGKKKDSTPFNILYSNTETLLPALYNSQPRPVVDRRFKDEDPLGKMAALAGQRILTFTLDTNTEDYETFDGVMGDAVLDALLPGRGMTMVEYEASTPEVEGSEVKTGEAVCFSSVQWDRVVFGFAHKWDRVPWIADRLEMTKEEAAEKFGAAVAHKMKFTDSKSAVEKDEEDGKTAEDDTGATDDQAKVASVWRIWDKDGGRKVRFIGGEYKEGFLAEQNDPLELTGFYPFPEPLRFLRKANDQTATALYTLYENQAKEINKITIRINKIVDAMKIRGAYDSALSELASILTKPDNTLVPADNVATLQDGGFEKAIWLVPIDKLPAVLQQLILARQQAKQTIYEITGISDILRGQSVASETATAQEIKNQWGSLRLKRMQKEVQRYARDLLRIALEIAANNFSEDTCSRMTGLPYPTQSEKERAQMTYQAAMQQAQMQAQAQGVPLGPPPPEMAQMMATAQSPSWKDVLAVLKDDLQRAYRIDIETNSTIDLEATEDQKAIAEVMTAISQFLTAVGPLIQQGVLPFQAAQGLLLGIVRRYKFGAEIEDYIKAMKPPTPPDQGAQQAEMQMKQKEADAKLQQGQQKMQHDDANHQADLQMKQAEQAAKREEMAMEMEFKRREHALKLEELQAKAEFNKLMAALKTRQMEEKMVADKAAAEEQRKTQAAAAKAKPAPARSK